MLIPIDIPPGLKSDDTTYAAAPGWADGSNVRFRLGRAQTIGGWESLMQAQVAGVCRTVLAWTDNANATLNIAFGTHSKLQLWQGGALYDITPFGPVTALGANPLATVNGSATVTVTHSAHGYASGQNLSISDAADTNGVTAANLNGVRAVTVTGPNTYTFTAGAAATSTASGGGSAVVAVPQSTLPAGAVDGTGSSGYGTGAYGVGGYGSPSTADYFPRTWSLAAWGQKLVASPRNGGLYQWSNNTAARAVAIAAAPAQITQIVVAPQRQIFALGCTQENGIWNPLCVRHSGVGDESQWATDASSSSTAREYVLPGGGRIVGGRFVGKHLLVWTSHSLFLGEYVGQVSQVWRINKVAEKCGLIGPNAVAVLGGAAYWISPDGQFHSYSPGGFVQPVPCPMREDFYDNLAASQADKITASTIAQYGEVRWDYPDSRDGYEVSRYVAVVVEGPDAGAWYRGRTVSGLNPSRTALVDAGPGAYPIGVDFNGKAFWHERGSSADGGPLSWYIQSADLFIDENSAVLVREVWPDNSADQTGPVTFTLMSRDHPQGEVASFPPLTLQPGQDKADLKASGRLFQVRYAGNSAPSYARLGRLLVDAKTRGRRG